MFQVTFYDDHEDQSLFYHNMYVLTAVNKLMTL